MRNTKYNNKGDKKKLSWIYRKKTKLQRSEKSTQESNDNAEENKKPRIIVRNLPFKATPEDVEKFFEPFGPVEEINFPKRTDGSPVGCCFIQFKQLEDASKAIFNTNKKEFLGRVINSSWAVSKSKYCEKLKKESTKNVDRAERQDTEINEEIKKDNHKQKRETPKTEEHVQIKKERRKSLKEKNRKKRARIVIRNLSFQATEENLKEHFSQYGTIVEVKILRRSDGQNVGCAFLQFEHVQSAAKAIHYANLQPLLNRLIVVDWAVPKNKFSTNDTKNMEEGEIKVKIEKGNDSEETPAPEIAKNSSEELGSDGTHVDTFSESYESDDEDQMVVESKSEDESKASNEELSEYGGDHSEEEEVEEAKKDITEEKCSRFESHDVSEGKTVFLKNVPFSVKNEQLKTFMERFGPVYYALVCIDSLTEFSKGTAFVKFRNVEDAEKCLTAGKELEMEDQIMEAQRALDRNEIETKTNSKKPKLKDSRNLYLVKEGVILAGSSAATGVSASDMAKRLQIEQWKSQILRNLNMFVSRTRLVVHNLPPTLDDVKLRKIFERHGPPNAIIREARVMRNLKNVDMKGVGLSKEYAFVSYTNHEDALQAMRNINNNPNVFSPKRRPIVSFSIENRVMVNARQRRIQKSRENNPTWSGNNAKRTGGDTNEEVPTKRFKTGESHQTEKNESNKKSFVGMTGKLGENKLRSKFKLKNQSMVHHQTVKKEKKLKKSWKKLEEKRRQRKTNTNEAKPKQRTKVKAEDVHIDKLVNSYKNKLKSIDLKKSKWYES